MHILEQYAVNCGAKIGKPFILKEFFPIPYEKYIVLHAGSGMDSKNYDYFNEVVDYLKPFLDSKNIKIVQIGGPQEKQIKNCYNALGTTKRQMAHIIDNSLLYFGNDTMSLHFASYFQKKIVCTSTVLYTSCFYPYWSKEGDYTIIESHRDGKKPTFSAQENPKTINLIKPEDIAKPILNYLEFDNFVLPKTEFIGDQYIYPVLEALPSQIISPNVFPNQMLNIRFDYEEEEYNYESVAQNLSIRKCAFIINKPIQIEILQNLFNNIEIVIYDITKNVDLDFIKKLDFFGLKYAFVFKKNEKNEQDLFQRKYDLIDSQIPIKEIEEKVKITIDLNNQNLILKTSKLLIDENKFYSSRAAQLEDKSSQFINGSLELKISDLNDKTKLLEDLSHAFIYTN